MDFFAQQERAQRHTLLLVVLFALAVVAIVAAVYFAVLGMLQVSEDGRLNWWNPELLAAVAGGVLLVVSLGSVWQIAQLASGGRVVAQMLGGQLISPGAADLKQRRLLNVVEEMAIAAGTMVPPVFVMPRESGINAFAAGFAPNDAVIGVSQGAIDQLTRDELQGVIGHEFSHILRGDMRLNIRLMGLLHGILLLSLIGMIAMRVAGEVLRHTPSSRDSDDKKGGNPVLAFAAAALALGLALYLIGYVGVFFGRLIKSAVSRQREYLADASSVQFTRNPAGLAGALKQIGAASAGSRLQTEYADEAAHLFFANALRESFLGLLATHPPLLDRIRRLDPTFDGRFIVHGPSNVVADQAMPVSGIVGDAGTVANLAEPAGIVTAELVSNLGAPQPAQVEYAAQVRADGWGPLGSWLNDPYSASALVFALLISNDPTIAARQFEQLATHVRADLVDAVRRVLPLAAQLDRVRRLPLVESAATPLYQLSVEQYRQFSAVLDLLVRTDGQISLFEYTLQRLLRERLRPQFERIARRRVQVFKIEQATTEAATLLAAVASAGQPDEPSAAAAFAQGMVVLGVASVAFPGSGPIKLAPFDAALDRFAAATPGVKRTIVEACAACIGADGRATLAEVELLRVICAALECPLPPVVN